MANNMNDDKRNTGSDQGSSAGSTNNSRDNGSSGSDTSSSRNS
ncbi:MAG TPA: hypothetical protein VHD55_01505 [Candidatus Paceibacterota bacterium]|nr:hypothetical protein [Candidatus Paceibacterota bacterium]